MKKSTIWAIAVIMGFSFLGLLFLQFSYVEEMVKMKKEQFDESVNRSLYQASRNLEMNETLRYLEKDVNETERRAFTQDSVFSDGLGSVQQSHQFAVAADDGTVYSSFQLKTFEIRPASVPKAMILRKDKNSLADAAKTMQEIVRKRYVYQKALLDEVVYNILYTASDKPLKERVNFRMLDHWLKFRDVKLTLDQPIIGTTVTLTDNIQSPAPVLTVEEGAHYLIYSDPEYQYSQWYTKSNDEYSTFEGTFEKGETYYIDFLLVPDFGYWLDDDTVVTASGATVEEAHGQMALSVSLSTQAVLPTVLGDADGDGRVTANDTTWIQRFILQMKVSSSFNESAADVNNDGKITVVDVTWIQRWLVGMTIPYSIGKAIYFYPPFLFRKGGYFFDVKKPI